MEVPCDLKNLNYLHMKTTLNPETMTFTQTGTFSIVIMLLLFLLCTGILIVSGFSLGPESMLLVFIDLIFMFCLLTFCKLTITVDNTSLSFTLGIGLFRKTYRMPDIKSCHPVTNSLLYGIGIHMIRNGWLYNVSGRKAIELQFKHNKRVVRIGTDRPEEVSSAVRSFLTGGQDVARDEGDAEATVKGLHPAWFISLLVLLLPVALIISGGREIDAALADGVLTIKGQYGQIIPLGEITGIDTLSILPAIERRTNGYSFRGTMTGHFRLSDKSRVMLYIKAKNPPFIRINSLNRDPVYLNFSDRQKTIALFNELKSIDEGLNP